MGCAYAGKHKNTWDYPFLHYDKYEVKGSNNFHRFESDLRTDKDVRKEFDNNSETGLISYLLFENGEIVIDESDIPTYAQGNRIIDDLLPSHSIGKSLVSYVTGHAICAGYVSSVNEKLTNKKKADLSIHVAEILTKKALEKKITKVYLDRGRYKYHGRIKIFAETLRKGGLTF